MAKTKNQIVEERRSRREVKRIADALPDLAEKNPRSKAVNHNIRSSGTTISKELSYARKIFNVLWEKLWPGEAKPKELAEWNEVAEKAKELAETLTN